MATDEAQARRWIESCAECLLDRAPLLTVNQARDIAGELHRAWPALSPTRAVACFVRTEELLLAARRMPVGISPHSRGFAR